MARQNGDSGHRLSLSEMLILQVLKTRPISRVGQPRKCCSKKGCMPVYKLQMLGKLTRKKEEGIRKEGFYWRGDLWNLDCKSLEALNKRNGALWTGLLASWVPDIIWTWFKASPPSLLTSDLHTASVSFRFVLNSNLLGVCWGLVRLPLFRWVFRTNCCPQILSNDRLTCALLFYSADLSFVSAILPNLGL